MKSRTLTCITGMTLFGSLMILLGFSRSTFGQEGVKTYTGSFTDGSSYVIDVPANWNGTLLLYSHLYDPPGTPLSARDNGEDPVLGFYFLSHGYALAGSSYVSSGWAVDSAFPDQIAVLDAFNSLVGKPKRTIAWGLSLGGIVTAGLVQKFPARFDGALSISGVLAGSVGVFNQWIDSAFAFKTLLASESELQIVNIINPDRNYAIANQALTEAQTSPQGRARIALVAALVDSPGWIDPLSPEPSPTDYATREANQFVSLQQNGDFFFFFGLGRWDMEERAGGNPSWNTGVRYRRELERSIDRAEVKELYARAGLSLDADLDTLDQAPRIAADRAAVKYLTQNISFNGDLDIPVVTLHTTADDAANVENEQAYAAVVHKGHDSRLLRELFVHRAGHISVTEAEIITAFHVLIRRLNTGEWGRLDPEDLNKEAAKLGRKYNVLCPPVLCGPLPVSPPAFIDYAPALFLRPFDAFSQERGSN